MKQLEWKHEVITCVKQLFGWLAYDYCQNFRRKDLREMIIPPLRLLFIHNDKYNSYYA